MKGKSADDSPNFTIKKTLTSRDAVALLLGAFPSLPKDVGEELSFDESHYVFARFADEVLHRMRDDVFFPAACNFISRLAESRDSFLTDILVTSFFESVVYHPDLSSKMKGYLGARAKELLQSVERHLLGK
jgi:hypothetical protein